MKQPHSTAPAEIRKSQREQRCEEAVRNCEQISARVKATGEELNACWTALGIEIATGASRTDLLRRRAWCNVLELRLREQTTQLEQARHDVDAVWKSIMNTARRHELNHRGHGKAGAEGILSKAWTLLLQPRSAAIRTRALAANEP